MPETHPGIIAILQASVAPVILVSGVGLLLLSMTNRYGRVIDRARALARENVAGAPGGRALADQTSIIWRRAKLLRAAIVLATLSIFFVVLTVAGVFAEQFAGVRAGATLIALLFVASLLFLAGSLVVFLRDIALSLNALRLELGSRTGE